MTYDTLASDQSLEKAIAGLKGRGSDAIVVENKEEALAEIQTRIPKGASVMNGASRTLEEIGYIELLKSGDHEWDNLHEKILAEKDPARQEKLRRLMTVSDYYLGSVHALAEDGQMVIASNTGSQLPHLVYSSKNLILVVSTQKITKDLGDAMKRLEEHVIPLEDARMKAAYGMGTTLSKVLIFKNEAKFNQRNVLVIFVKEKLGF